MHKKINFVKNRPHIEVPPQDSRTLMQILLGHDIPVASSCLGEGICGKCAVTIARSTGTLSPCDENEKKVLVQNKCSPKSRLSCQIVDFQEIWIDANYW